MNRFCSEIQHLKSQLESADTIPEETPAMVVRLGGNIPSLKAQRHLNRSSEELGNSYQRLGSGLRINGAADDPAGLAVSSILNLEARIYTQGIKNINDGISLLNVAQGGLSQLASLAVRQQELAEQAANGVFSLTQRKAIDKEAHALREEWNRIIGSTSFK